MHVDTECKPCIMQIMETRKEKHKAHEVQSTNCLHNPLDKCIESVYHELAFELFFNNQSSQD